MIVDRRQILTSPAALVPFVPSSLRAMAMDKADNAHDPVFLHDLGAKLDGLTDDSAALQRAVDICLAVNPARPLIVQGPCRVERSVLIDRPVDKTHGVFRVIGQGAKGGFVVAGNFALFDSNLDNPSAPLSEHVWFQSIRFEAIETAPKATCLSDKFLRVQFHDCEFERIRALNGKKYAQEWHFSRCIVRRWTGSFFSSHGGYHIISTGGKYQNGAGTVFEIADPKLSAAGCIGCAFHQDIAEANTGSFLKAAIVRGLSVSGLYWEGNYGPAIDMDTSAPNQGVSVSGCMFVPQDENKAIKDFFDIKWGFIEAGHSGGNYSSGRLHHHRAANAGSLVIAGDYAALQLTKHIT